MVPELDAGALEPEHSNLGAWGSLATFCWLLIIFYIFLISSCDSATLDRARTGQILSCSGGRGSIPRGPWVWAQAQQTSLLETMSITLGILTGKAGARIRKCKVVSVENTLLLPAACDVGTPLRKHKRNNGQKNKSQSGLPYIAQPGQ